ncbi:MAG TPA: class I SAM-dependent RNA methyltransferase [Polyangiaceae bacterium]|nr:class I SAM-dependent RNA methyltransferase [Polyangiaceae bacterium]
MSNGRTRTASVTVTATISSLAPGGAGVTHVEQGGERRAVFVPQTAPGDRVRLEVDLSSRPARGRVLDLIETGADRVEPPCRWSAACGGCDWMHLSAHAQLREHAEQVRAALPAAWRSMEIATHPAPASLAYRTRARLHVRIGRGGHVVVGMNEAGTREPVEVGTCIVLDPALEAIRAMLSGFFEGGSGRGDVQMALGRDRCPVLDVRWSGELAPPAYARFERAVAQGIVAGVRVTERDAKRPARIGDPTPWMAGADGKPLRLAPGGFGQASEAANVALALHAAATADALGQTGSLTAPLKAVELYAGAGNLSILLARTTDLVCVESDPEGCDAARENLGARGLSARVTSADAADYPWAPSTKLVVLDPPRTGARAVAERLAKTRVAHVIYVSCDAQTLGRDLAILEASYAPASVATFEMFPQTSHVETVIALVRRRG